MKIKKISPRGYCYGVVDAMKLANEAVANPDYHGQSIYSV